VVLVYVNLNNMFDLRRVCAALILCGLWVLSFWTPLVVILSKFHLVHIIYHFFSSKAGSSRIAGEGVALEKSSSKSIGDLWP
jgi:hypothetical protein